MQDIHSVYESQQKNRWRIAKTTAEERIAKLKKLKEAINEKKEEIHKAIFDDFRKNPGETDLTEIFPAIGECNHAIHDLKKWMKPKSVKTPLVLFGTHSKIHYEPKGVVLILSPWNYPFQLLITPLISAIAAGNCVMIKPSSKVPHTAAFTKKFLADLFPEDEVAVIEGNSSVADELLKLPFDHIFFTGSIPVGKKVMEAAAKNLTPVTLELGGKSPVILDESADVSKAAERIVWGKFVNAGQTCVAPDYLMIHKNKVNDFVAAAKKVIHKRYGINEKNQEQSPDFCRLVSKPHASGLKKIIDESVASGCKLEMGGVADIESRFLSPTIITNVKADSPLMRDEIFGPILPILSYSSLDEVYEIIHSHPKPLALYIFSHNNHNIKEILKNTTAGGTCVNSLLIHLANSNLPFGGVGHSGMGNYHGAFGFKTFSHERAVLKQGKIDSLKFFYPPYTKTVRKMIDWATKFFA